MEQPHPKPRRTAMWILIILGSLLLLAGIGFIYSVFFEVGSIKKPMVPTPAWDEAKYLSPKNPYRHYETAMRLLTQYDADILMYYHYQSLHGEPYPGKLPIAKREVELSLPNVAPAIAEVLKGANCSVNDFQFIKKDISYLTTFPELSELRELASTVRAEAYYRINHGKINEGIEQCFAIVNMCNGIARAEGLLGRSVAWRSKDSTYETIHSAVGKQGLKAADYKKIAMRLQRASSEIVPLRESVEQSFLITRKVLCEMLQLGPEELEKQSIWLFDVNAKVTFVCLSIPGMKSKIVSNFDRAYSILLACSDKPYPKVAAVNFNQLVPEWDTINDQLFANCESIFSHTAEDLALNRGIMLMAALEAFRLEKGQYPNALSDLAAGGYISKPPDDPFTENKPFRYIKKGSKYLLYSIGGDLSDEGGSAVIPYHEITTDNRGDIVFSPGLNIWQQPQSKTHPGGRGGTGGRGGPGSRRGP